MAKVVLSPCLMICHYFSYILLIKIAPGSGVLAQQAIANKAFHLFPQPTVNWVGETLFLACHNTWWAAIFLPPFCADIYRVAHVISSLTASSQ